MERSDSRLLPVPVLKERRRAVMLHLRGMTLDAVSDMCELSRNTVIDAMKGYREGGGEAIPVRTHRGPAKGEGCLLDARRQETIRVVICAHTPDELELPFALWSRPAVTALVEHETGVRLAMRTARQVFETMGG